MMVRVYICNPYPITNNSGWGWWWWWWWWWWLSSMPFPKHIVIIFYQRPYWFNGILTRSLDEAAWTPRRLTPHAGDLREKNRRVYRTFPLLNLSQGSPAPPKKNLKVIHWLGRTVLSLMCSCSYNSSRTGIQTGRTCSTLQTLQPYLSSQFTSPNSLTWERKVKTSLCFSS